MMNVAAQFTGIAYQHIIRHGAKERPARSAGAIDSNASGTRFRGGMSQHVSTALRAGAWIVCWG